MNIRIIAGVLVMVLSTSAYATGLFLAPRGFGLWHAVGRLWLVRVM